MIESVGFYVKDQAQILCKTDQYYIPIYWEMLLKVGDFNFESEKYSIKTQFKIDSIEPYLAFYPNNSEFKIFLNWIKEKELTLKINGLDQIYTEQSYYYSQVPEEYLAKYTSEELLQKIIDCDFQYTEIPDEPAWNLDECIERMGFVELNFQTGDYLKFSKIALPPKYRAENKILRGQIGDAIFNLLIPTFVLALLLLLLIGSLRQPATIQKLTRFDVTALKAWVAFAITTIGAIIAGVVDFSILKNIIVLFNQLNQNKAKIKQLEQS